MRLVFHDMHVYVHICMYIYTYVCISTHMYVYLHICMCMYTMRLQSYVQIIVPRACIQRDTASSFAYNTRTYIHARKTLSSHVCMCVYIYIYIYAYICRKGKFASSCAHVVVSTLIGFRADFHVHVHGHV